MDGQGHWTSWRENAQRRGVGTHIVSEIGQRFDLIPESFELLGNMAEIKDPRGKSFFLIPPDTDGDDVREAALLTYVLNAGTDYGRTGRRPTDFPATPYGAAEIARIMNRQKANGWSYARDVAFVHRNGGRLATTPNGILMGAGGNLIQRQFSQRGGTTWGDIFMINTGRRTDPAALLRHIIASERIDLDRLLHHEERHCRQWAERGHVGMLRAYGWELFRELIFGATNRLEADAGLGDGGYSA